MSKSGMADRLMDFANELIGRVRGGLAHVNAVVSLLFAGLTGVGRATLPTPVSRARV